MKEHFAGKGLFKKKVTLCSLINTQYKYDLLAHLGLFAEEKQKQYFLPHIFSIENIQTVLQAVVKIFGFLCLKEPHKSQYVGGFSSCMMFAYNTVRFSGTSRPKGDGNETLSFRKKLGIRQRAYKTACILFFSLPELQMLASLDHFSLWH